MNKHLFPILALFFFTAACSTEDTGPGQSQLIKKEKVSGVVQKGPFVSGTSILMSELNTELVQTGKVFTSTISNDLGLFEVNNIELNSSFVEFTASGFYFNEVSGVISTAPITLSSLSDLTNKSSINVNVLTHLEKRRVETLIKEGKSFSQAKNQSREELLTIFSMTLSGTSSLEEFDILKNNDEGGILLAVSILIQGNRSVGQVTELLSKMQSDFGDNGLMDNKSLLDSLWNTTFTINTQTIRDKIDDKFKTLGITNAAPNFEKYLSQFESSLPNNPNFFLNENNVTCMCPNAKVGEKGVVNGRIYEAVDNESLRQKMLEGVDISKLCTSLVTNMSELFYKYGSGQKNPPIGNWDVSNVTNMQGMFRDGTIFKDQNFDQSIEFWNVSKVENMSFMFSNSKFNQPIDKWDVRKVATMREMFSSSEFNQALDKWNTSNVQDMSRMFLSSQFDQPIGSWKVSNVEDMTLMFGYSQFDQDITGWCVVKIPSEPQGFSANSPLTEEKKPKWGTCPN